MLSQVFRSNRPEEDNHAAQPGEKSSPYANDMTEPVAAIRKKDNQKESQQRR